MVKIAVLTRKSRGLVYVYRVVQNRVYPDADMLVIAPSATKAKNFFNTLNKTALEVP